MFSKPRRRQLKINQVWKLLFKHDWCKYSFTTGHWLNFVAILAQQYYYNMPDPALVQSRMNSVNIICSHFFYFKQKNQILWKMMLHHEKPNIESLLVLLKVDDIFEKMASTV